MKTIDKQETTTQNENERRLTLIDEDGNMLTKTYIVPKNAYDDGLLKAYLGQAWPTGMDLNDRKFLLVSAQRYIGKQVFTDKGVVATVEYVVGRKWEAVHREVIDLKSSNLSSVDSLQAVAYTKAGDKEYIPLSQMRSRIRTFKRVQAK